jgi:alpha-L-fucosidase
LNVGPKADGTFPKESIDILKEMGEWMKINGEAIYGTKASPFGLFAWGRCTKKESSSSTILYLSVFEWPKDGKLLVPGLTNDVISARLLANGKSLKTQAAKDALIISIPDKQLDPIATVIKIEVKGKVENKLADKKDNMKAGELD